MQVPGALIARGMAFIYPRAMACVCFILGTGGGVISQRLGTGLPYVRPREGNRVNGLEPNGS